MLPATSEEESLLHYGVKGMRWGVITKEKVSDARKRHSDNVKTRREEKAKEFDRKAAELQKEIDVISARPAKTPYEQSVKEVQLNELQHNKKDALESAKAKREGKLTPHEKRVLVGVGVATAVVATVVTYNSLQSGRLNATAIRGKAFLHNSGVVSWKKNDRLADPSFSAEDIAKHVVPGINPEYGKLGSKMNCRRCTFAYEMRRRGNAVSATRTTNGRGQSISGVYNATNDVTDYAGQSRIGLAYHGAKEQLRKSTKSVEDKPFFRMINRAMEEKNAWGEETFEDSAVGMSDHIFSRLKNQPDGARGELGLGWRTGGGHSVAWEIVKGKPVIFDTQTGKMIKDSADFDAAYPMGAVQAGITRLDNKDLNDRFLARWLKSD